MAEPDSVIRSKQYEKIKLIVGIADFLISFTILILSIALHWNVAFADAARRFSGNPYLVFLIFGAIYGLILGVVTFPLGFYSGYIIEHRFGLSNQSIWSWLWERVKGMLVGLLISLPIALVFYFVLRNNPQLWWFWVAVFLFFFSIVLARLAPILIFPLFYKFEPLENEALKERILRLSEKAGLKVKAVLRFNLSKTTKKANAGFTGIGKSKRIILSDTLLENFTDDEIETVFAHELGHYYHKHIRKNLVIGFCTTFIGLYLAHIFYQWGAVKLGYTALDQLEALPLLAIILTIYGLITTPLQNIISRHFERQADRYAVLQTGKKEQFISALEKLADQNLADRSPHPVIEFLFYSHPSIERRVRMVRNL